MALDMIEAITDLKDPSTGQHLKIRVGVHSGAVVAGIVGLKMPRYLHKMLLTLQIYKLYTKRQGTVYLATLLTQPVEWNQQVQL
jgi:hypothetical protein